MCILTWKNEIFVFNLLLTVFGKVYDTTSSICKFILFGTSEKNEECPYYPTFGDVTNFTVYKTMMVVMKLL